MISSTPCTFYGHNIFAHAIRISDARLTDVTNNPDILVTNTLWFISQ